MASDVASFVAESPLVDTHEHLMKEHDFLEASWDVLVAVFNPYVTFDLVVAGASWEDVQALLDPGAGSVSDRFERISAAWEACRHGGYGEAVRATARLLFGIDELTAETLERADAAARALQRPGERLRVLRDVAGLDHVQVDDWRFDCEADPSGPEFFLYDLGLNWPISGRIDVEDIHAVTGVEVRDVSTLDEALETIFARYGAASIAVKSQHAYQRTLAWEERDRRDAERAVAAVLAGEAGEGDRICAGDWAWARAVELAIEHDLPFKLHTGHYGRAAMGMPVERIRPGQLSPLLVRYPDARFVLMHIAYPFDAELTAVAKHFPNVWVDLCWAWSLDPHTTCDFVRRMLHAVPVNKLFAFGGDDRWFTSSLGDSWQARRWLTRALEAEAAEGDMTEREAIDVARRLMFENQYACFDVEGTRRAIAERAAAAAAPQAPA